jgi:hypothetical protein
MNRLMIGVVMFLGLLAPAPAQYAGWQHSGSIFLITTPEGANLPATASEENFPLLVRLNKDSFNFSQAKAGGDDIRFSAEGKPLAYQIEDWDAVAGTASIWVRIPNIKGNARQEIKIYWGKADAASESKGDAVFNDSNGYVSVLHMSDPVKDEVGSVQPKDTGTAASVGIIGKSRRFDVGKGINCGEKLTTLPTGSNPHSTEVWIKPEKSNVNPIAWGNEQAQGKVVMGFVSPPHIRMDCYFSGGSVASSGLLPLKQWIHVVHTYKEGESRIYVNGVLDGENASKGSPLNIRTPARMYVGGWYGWGNAFMFEGDIDEVRLSKVTRSADWVKLEYENQKSRQTLVGSLVQPGSDFSVSEKKITVLEGKSATVTAKAGGAQKVYWILKRDGLETIMEVDKFSFTVEAGRVTGDQSLTLQFKAVLADTVKTIDIPVRIQEDVPDPVFTLKAPLQWDGRETIEVVPQVSNLKDMQKKNVGELQYDWKVSGMAVIKEIEPGKLILKRSHSSGKMTVTAAVSNGGKLVDQTAQIVVKEPKKDAWVPRTPDKDEKPVDNQFYARDDQNEGTLYCNGTLSNTADTVFLRLYADDKLIQNESRKPGPGGSYAFSVKLKSGLIKYRVEFGTRIGSTETILHTADNLICGDAYIINGQSNAEAWADQVVHPYKSEWLRSFGSPIADPVFARKEIWGNALSFNGGESRHNLQIGYWGVELGKRWIEEFKVPVFFINGAAGGTRIDQHLRNPEDPEDVKTIYGRLLWRLRQAKLTHGIRGVLWHQGENDQGADGPAGTYGWENYQQNFIALAAAWKQDFPNIQHYYLFQIWPRACGMGGNGSDNRLREVQRTLPGMFSNLGIMSTLGIDPPGGCHYPPAGYAMFATLLGPLVERDNYGKVFEQSITPPDLKSASYASDKKDEIVLEFDQPVKWDNTLVSEFYLDGQKGEVVSGTVSGNVILLKLRGTSTAGKITYLDSKSWSQKNLLRGENGIAALTFCEVPVTQGNESR